MQTNNKLREALKKCVDELAPFCDGGCRRDEVLEEAKTALAAPPEPIGNAAKIRKALIIVYDWILKAGNVHGYPDTEQKRRQLYDMMTKALSASPRNCDVGNMEEQYKRHCKWCKKMRDYSCAQSMCRECYAKWSQESYEEGGVE